MVARTPLARIRGLGAAGTHDNNIVGVILNRIGRGHNQFPKPSCKRK